MKFSTGPLTMFFGSGSIPSLLQLEIYSWSLSISSFDSTMILKESSFSSLNFGKISLAKDDFRSSIFSLFQISLKFEISKIVPLFILYFEYSAGKLDTTLLLTGISLNNFFESNSKKLQSTSNFSILECF